MNTSPALAFLRRHLARTLVLATCVLPLPLAAQWSGLPGTNNAITTDTDRPYEPAARLPPLLAAARGIDSAAVAAAALARGRQGPEIGAAVHAARTEAVAGRLAAAPG